MAADRSFAERLHQELPRWVEEGLIPGDAAERLRERYPAPARRETSALTALYVLGALMIGGGVLSLVAWNWETLAAGWKVALLGTGLAVVHAVGYRLWRFEPRTQLGHGLLVLASVLFGATVGLIVQIFHLDTSWYDVLGIWAAGSLVAAWAYRSLPTALLAVALAAVWGFAAVEKVTVGYPAIPWGIALLFLPLAWHLRSSLVAGLALLAAGGTFATAAGVAFGGNQETGAMPGALAVSILLVIAGTRLPDPTRLRGLGRWLRGAGVAAFVSGAFPLTFRSQADAVWWPGWSAMDHVAFFAFLIGPALLGGAVLWVASSRSGTARASVPSWSWALVAGAFVLLAMTVWGWPPCTLLFVTANAALLLLAVVAVQSGAREGRRARFWMGMTLAVGLIVSRFLEFDTGLLVKGVVFIGCGIAVILLGRMFERRIRNNGGDHA